MGTDRLSPDGRLMVVSGKGLSASEYGCVGLSVVWLHEMLELGFQLRACSIKTRPEVTTTGVRTLSLSNHWHIYTIQLICPNST